MRLEDICKRNTQRALEADARMPNWPANQRGVPNSVLRSALFGAFGRGKRKFMQDEPIASVEGVSIFYTGQQLDQSDLDVWEGILHLSRDLRLGARIEFTARGILRLIGRGGASGDSIGSSDREWLRNVFRRLKATNVECRQGPFAYGGSLIDEYFRDDSIGRYVVRLNPRLKLLFNRNGWTSVDWKIRSTLRGHPLAQWLHGFYSSHADPFPYKVATLHRLCGSGTGAGAATVVQMNKALQGWRDATLAPALRALESACNSHEQSFSWDMPGGELVSVNRDPSKSQEKHLQRKFADGKKPARPGDSIGGNRGMRSESGGQHQPKAGERMGNFGG
jgi:hypothetical protein